MQMATQSVEKKGDNLNLKTICNELAVIASKFLLIGVNLEVPYPKLKEFENDKNPLICVINYLLMNGVSKDCPLSWQRIVEALESESVCEPGLAREIAKKYCKADELQDKSTLIDSEPAAVSIVSSHTSSGDSSWIPPPVDLAPHFPFLSQKEREDTIHLRKLKDETKEIKRKFESLVFDLLKDIETTPLKDVVTILRFDCDSEFESILKDCSNLYDVFMTMFKFISFFDYGPIKLLSSKFASNAFKNKMKRYKRKFQNYAKRRICECPSNAFVNPNNNEKVYALKIEKDFATLTFEEVDTFRYEMNKILGHTCLRLLNVTDGCVEFIFRGVKDEFSISEDQQKALRSLGVVSIRYGDEVMCSYAAEIPQKITVKEKTNDVLSDSGVHTRETMATSSKLSGYTESFITHSTARFHKVKDLRDFRLDMIIEAESKPQELPFLSSLQQAIGMGNLRRVKQLVKKGENPMATDINNNSCLHYAAQFCQFEILKYLIEVALCPPGIEGWKGRTILHVAAEMNQLDMVQYLVDSEHCKLDPTLEDSNGHSALHFACKGGNLSVVRYLTESMSAYMKLEDILLDENCMSPQMDSQPSQKGISSPLSWACAHGNLPVVKYFTEECHFNPFKSHNAIISAVSGNCLDVLKYLATRPNFSTIDTEPSLVLLAVFEASKKMVEYLTLTLHCDFKKDMNISPLELASSNGKLDIVKFLVNVLKCDPNTKGSIGYQPIHYAASHGQLHIVKFFIKKHIVSATAQTEAGETPLQLASEYGHLNIVKYLTTEHNCDPMSVSEGIGCSFHFAAKKGQVEIARYFVKSLRCDPNCNTGMYENTPLHVAADCGHLAFVKCMIEELGSNVASTNFDGRTPLQAAIKNGHDSVIRYLIEEQKCDVHYTDYNHWNIVLTAVYFGKLDVLKYLVEEIGMVSYIRNGDALCLTASNGHLHIVRYLLENGSRHYDSNLFTPLHNAAEEGHLDIVEYIMNCPELCSMYSTHPGKLPLHVAIKNGHIDIVKYFIEEKQCDLNFIAHNGLTFLHLAAMFGQLEIIKYLALETKCDLLAKDLNSMTPLHHAADNGHFRVVKSLIEELNCDPKLSGIIHYAAQSGELDIVKYFIHEHSCDPHHLDNDGMMPIHLAALAGKVNVIKYLVEELKCDPMSKDSIQCTPLHHAALKGHLDVVKYLLEEHSCNPCSENVYTSTPLNFSCL